MGLHSWYVKLETRTLFIMYLWKKSRPPPSTHTHTNTSWFCGYFQGKTPRLFYRNKKVKRSANWSVSKECFCPLLSGWRACNCYKAYKATTAGHMDEDHWICKGDDEAGGRGGRVGGGGSEEVGDIFVTALDPSLQGGCSSRLCSPWVSSRVNLRREDDTSR